MQLVGQLLMQFNTLTDIIDIGAPSGRHFFHVMASLAKMERELIVKHTRAGLDVSRRLGRKGGLKSKLTESKIKSAKKVLSNGVTANEVVKNLGIFVPTLYRCVTASAQT